MTNERSVFTEKIERSAAAFNSRIVLALDLDYRTDITSLLSDAKKIVNLTHDLVCAVKMNFHLILPMGLSELRNLNEFIKSFDLVSIADLKLNDIDNTNRVAAQYLSSAGFSAVIVNPLVGFDGGLDSVFKLAHELEMGVITLGYMSHRGASEGFGLELADGRTTFQLCLERAKLWGADGVVVGTTRKEKIEQARKVLGGEMKIFSPGSGAQGGDALGSVEAGADYLIYGRSIVESKDPRSSALQISQQLLARTEKHQRP